MEFFEAVRVRRSCRRFTSDAVPDDVINKALDAALIAPNSSNMQTWEFHWVRSEDKKRDLVAACLGQPAAASARELVVAVARIDTWKRQREMMLAALGKTPGVPPSAIDYYKKLMPIVYAHGPLNIIGFFKWLGVHTLGLFRPTPRGPSFKHEIMAMAVKSSALACQNFMLAMAAEGYGTCPMEGFDEVRVKKILGLGCSSSVVMVLACGKIDPLGIYGPQLRFARDLFVKTI